MTDVVAEPVTESATEPMTEAQVFASIRAIFFERFDLPPEAVHMQTRLIDDLQFDSLDQIDLVIGIEKFAGRRVKIDEMNAPQTVGDVVRACHAVLASSPA